MTPRRVRSACEGPATAGTPPRRLRLHLATQGLLFALTLSACASGGTAGGAGMDPPAAPASATQGTYTEADVRFMQGMLPHHRQALEMTALVDDRTDTRAIRLLAERIEISQTDEIAQLERWLEERGENVSAGGAPAHHDGGHQHHAAGMLTPAQMERLAAAQGAEFDRLFLEYMIQHHEGALVMVGQLLASPGAAQDVDAYRIASEIDSDQRIEIERMQRMLSALG